MVVRRALVLVLAIAALVLSGFLAAGAKPLALKPAATTTTTATGTAPGGLSVSEAVEGNGNIDVAAQGPNHSLYFYWQIGGTWRGPLGIGGAGTAYSAPSLTIEPNGNLDIVVQGPGNSLNHFWQIGGTWSGPLGIAGSGGATWSSPSLGVDPGAPGHLYVAAQGPSNSLYFYWHIGANWNGPLQISNPKTTFSAPSLVTFSTTSLGIGAVNQNNQEAFYSETNGTWKSPLYSGTNEAYSPGTGAIIFMGPSNSLILYGPQTNVYVVIGGANTTYSSPSLTGNAVAAEGPGHSLYYWWNAGGNGPLQVSSPGTINSAPSLATEPSGNQDIAVQGPNNTLWAFWEINGTWSGPLQVGGAGTTFSSSS